MSRKDDERGRHQVHIDLPLDVFNRITTILDGASISSLFRRMAIRYIEIYDTGGIKPTKIDKLTATIIKDDLERCLIDEKPGGLHSAD